MLHDSKISGQRLQNSNLADIAQNFVGLANVTTTSFGLAAEQVRQRWSSHRRRHQLITRRLAFGEAMRLAQRDLVMLVQPTVSASPPSSLQPRDAKAKGGVLELPIHFAGFCTEAAVSIAPAKGF